MPKITRLKHRLRPKDLPVSRGFSIYVCGDCYEETDSSYCKECRRQTWRWCELCREHRSQSHDHFKGTSDQKRKKRWTNEDFPTEKHGKFFCGDCQRESGKKICPTINCMRGC